MRFVTTILMVLVGFTVSAQSAPAGPQKRSVLIMNATAHIGDGRVIENALIGFEGGKLTLVADATTARVDMSRFQEVVQAAGKHVYPGFIAPASTLGLIEINAVRSTNDVDEVGKFNPHIRSIIAYYADSRITPTVRNKGTLMTQVVPGGGFLRGQSSVVQLDAWNWEDAAYRTDVGQHLNWPSMYARGAKHNENYAAEILELEDYFAEAKAYMAGTHDVKNIRFEAMKPLFNGTQSLFVHTNRAKTMLDAVAFAKKFKLKLVIVGGAESWMITSQLKEANVSIVLGMTQDLPMNDDHDIDQPYKTPVKLYAEGIPFTISMEGMGWQLHNFGFQAGQAVPFGLPYEQAVKSITLSAAQILGIDSTCGSLEAGKDATLFISEGDALDQRTLNVTSAYIQGRTIDLDDKQKLLYRTYKTKYESQK